MDLLFRTTDPELADLNNTLVEVTDLTLFVPGKGNTPLTPPPQHLVVSVIGTPHVIVASWHELVVTR